MKEKLNKLKDNFQNYRDKPFRPHQIEALEQIMECESRVIVLKAPPGSGKSLIGMTMLQEKGNGLYLVHSKMLQTQLNHDFPEPESVVLFGRSNYPCGSDRAEPGTTAADCIDEKCKLACEYKIQKKKAVESSIAVLNYAYALTEWNYVGKFSERDLVVIDEADMLDKILSDFIGLSITERNMRALNLRTPEYKSEGANALIDWQEWAKEGYKLTCKYIEAMKKEEARWGIMSEPDEYERSQMKKLQQYKNLKYRFGVMVEHLNKDWVCQVTESKWGETWSWKPNWMIPELAEHALWQHGGQFLLMSGTMHPKPILSLLLGIPENDIEYFEVKTDFPPENRPIYLKPVANMVFKEMKEETPKIVEAVEQVLTDHPDVKGIIHTVSYSLTQAIMEIESPRLITHDATNKQEVIQKFRDSIRPLILVSPSSERGLDLPDESCRLIIMVKAPFLSLGDKFVSKRVYSSRTGQKWYISDLLMTIEQAASRGMRHQEDFCTVICLDKQIIRAITDNPGIVSEYFRESLIFCGGER